MSTPTEFPDLSEGLALARGESPVFLNGMKVVFDRKVALYPVELEERGESEHGNGSPRGAPAGEP
jgi:hypothetical protein